MRKKGKALLANGMPAKRRGGRNGQRLAVAEARNAVLQEAILELRVQGLSEKAIAKHLVEEKEVKGVPTTTMTGSKVGKLLREALDEIVIPGAENLKRLELERLDAIINGHYEGAINGDVGATHALLACVDRRNRLLGIGADVRTQSVGADGKATDPARPVINLTIATVARRPD